MSFICEKCNHVLKSKWGLKRHFDKCDGISPLECPHCYKLFADKYAKSKHTKICKCNPDNDHTETTTNNTIDNCTIMHSTVNVGSNNTTNNYNNNINVIKFEIDKKKDTKFISSHITPQEIQEILETYFDLRDRFNHVDIINEYFNRLLDLPENKCIKKTDIKSKYSHIHTGGNKWVMRPDRNIYDKLIIDTTKNFFHKLDETDKIKNKEFQRKVSNIRNSTEHLTDHIFEDEKELIKDLQVATDAIKCTVVNHTAEE